MTGISGAPSHAITSALTESNHPLRRHLLQQEKSKENSVSPEQKAFSLTQMSEFFSLPPLALFRSLIQVAFMSRIEPLASAAVALGTDPQRALSPGEPQHLCYPCSKKPLFSVPFSHWGSHSQPQLTPV